MPAGGGARRDERRYYGDAYLPCHSDPAHHNLRRAHDRARGRLRRRAQHHEPRRAGEVRREGGMQMRRPLHAARGPHDALHHAQLRVHACLPRLHINWRGSSDNKAQQERKVQALNALPHDRVTNEYVLIGGYGVKSFSKKFVCFVVILVLSIFLAACNSSPYDDGYEFGYSDGKHDGYLEGYSDGEEAGYEHYVEEAEENFDPNEIIEWVLSNYSIEDLMEWKYGSVYDYYFEAGAPNLMLFVDESVGQGHPEYIRYLSHFCDTIGYYPSLIFGDFCADGDFCIHKVSSPCFDSIDAKELRLMYADIRHVFEHPEESLYSFCEICCGEYSS